MSTDLLNRRLRLASRPHGEPAPTDFVHDEVPVPSPGPGQVLLRTLHLSLDPYVRGRMSAAKSYAAPMELGDVIVGGTVSEVVESTVEDLSPGDVVLGYGGWQEYSVEDAAGLRRLDPAVAPVSTALGVLGMPGFTAYAGLLAIGRPAPGETVAVAAATGPVGSAVAQIAQLRGARAIGIAGGERKVAHLRELGVDAALDHRAPDLPGRLADAAPDGIDVYFENVGGAVWDAVLPQLNEFARVPVCGLAASYNATALPEGPDRSGQLMGAVLTRSLTLRGFIQREFVPTMFEDFLRDMGGWVASGQVRYTEDVTEGLDRAPEAFVGMLRGDNLGKTLVRVA
ncbi:NADP-dependent oxidoreductase [Brachybacterium saurashtrense]|uniref:NADP-dependent oxidoreductase n=1 Tax=Brachybacterium saurashtrense TaxID=556288 RepID=A0A345YPS2_9MICO|nr:NADP-dependent oxidoreductase [Brachybacterium saurashtrense]AXK45924.1 NADP-dependent oxidoreductase [Brachybacterium saurashtrense]RRR23662.1 NADP-dependent oxidoreductase [Brachybacterium saurashtrense]